MKGKNYSEDRIMKILSLETIKDIARNPGGSLVIIVTHEVINSLKNNEVAKLECFGSAIRLIVMIPQGKFEEVYDVTTRSN